MAEHGFKIDTGFLFALVWLSVLFYFIYYNIKVYIKRKVLEKEVNKLGYEPTTEQVKSFISFLADFEPSGAYEMWTKLKATNTLCQNSKNASSDVKHKLRQLMSAKGVRL